MSTADKVIITIAGNMGVGKTALTERLADDMRWAPFFEQQDVNPYIEDFYNDMPRWAFHSQLFFLAKRLELYRKMMSSQHRTIVQDRGIFEDAEVFAKNLYREGKISERDYNLYTDLYEECLSLMPQPGFVVYLKARVNTLKDRIAKRGRDYEKDVDTAYLENLNELYEEWIDTFTTCPVLTIEVDKLDFVNSEAAFCKVRDRIVEQLAAWRQERLSF